LERYTTLLHPLHIVVVGQDLAGGGVYIYVTNGAARCVGEGGYNSIETPDRLALRLSQERLVGHHHIAHTTGRILIYRRADMFAEEITGKIGYFLDDRRR
jgi:hypothetical protein